ncbi:NAD(P)/FAD-dependent oxidoreductase [Cereibacter sphaeroides]|uniref:NAD(P)/FAD-dependent oxidoreductase n=1 Tax=Cereibacter sphaeroides TaxID=1063 RepID=UPI000F52EF8C|nr:NAD(P)/FAD-dependent oxidoreductase [Cereibacter sphaeroides]AZB56817.1 NAD(P)/FAD-dependent oxidoreductase [Cereibacter sphaeroides]AZB59654.1 NAD(P)/FAD-dependent oxidoreductase [Cereibacter sphaeroides]
MEKTDVLILGAGAAGMFCAIEAGRRGRRVLVLDRARAPGEKIRISGGGRCNFTNLGIAPERFLSRNPRFALSALKRFTQWDFIARIDAAGIAWHEKVLGQLFCDGPATQIVDMLVRQMREAGVELRLGVEPGEIRRLSEGFEVDTPAGPVRAASVVVGTGGKSIPKMGATGYAYRVAESFGLPVVETRPGLVPLTFAAQELERLKALAGLAVPARVSAGGTSFDEALLFTHRGLSGPAILQASSYWREGMPLLVNLAPEGDPGPALRAARNEQPRSAARTILARHLPERLARHLETVAGIEGPIGAQSNATLDRLAGLLRGWELRPVGTEGYRTAEVTLGGVDTDHLDARTLEARAVPGLHFVGEAVDVTGWLGGYNFQWAWSSGWAAGQAV